MLDFPSATAFGRAIPKTTFYQNLSVDPALKKVFVTEIEKIVWRNKLSPATLHVQPGRRVAEVQVIEIVLKGNSLSPRVLKIIDKGIPYHLLFVLRRGDRCMACMGYKDDDHPSVQEYFQTAWLTATELPLQIVGLTMDDVHDNFMRQIHQALETHHTKSLAEAVQADARQRRLQKKIAKLEQMARAEKQPKRKFTLFDAIRKLQHTAGEEDGKAEDAHAGRRG